MSSLTDELGSGNDLIRGVWPEDNVLLAEVLETVDRFTLQDGHGISLIRNPTGD
jgi:hypothetical protein